MVVLKDSPTAMFSQPTAQLATHGFDAVQIARESITTPGSTVSYRIYDANIDDNTGATVLTEADALPTDVAVDAGSITFESLDTGIATVDATGRVTRVSDGTARILVKGTYFTRLLLVTVAENTPATATVFGSWATGSLAADAAAAIDTRLVGATPSTDKLVHDGAAYNAICWVANIDLTGVSIDIPRATLITPRHIVMAEHYQQGLGATVSFLKADGTQVDRTIAGKVNVGAANSSDAYLTDVAVAVLDSDVPAGITPIEIVPSDLDDYLPDPQWGIPVLIVDQDEQALTADLYKISSFATLSVPTDATRKLFYEALVGGDSGSPMFLIVDDAPVLLSTATFGFAGSGPLYQDLHAEINTAIAAADADASVSTGYTVMAADVTSYGDYLSLERLMDTFAIDSHYRCADITTVTTDRKGNVHGTWLSTPTLVASLLADDPDRAVDNDGANYTILGDINDHDYNGFVDDFTIMFVVSDRKSVV